MGIVAAVAATSADSCTALALSGGGSNGAWEAGVLWGLLNEGNPDDFRYDVISGISAGSINALGLAGWGIGKEKEAAQFLSDAWKNLRTHMVWKKWPHELIDVLLTKQGAVDNSPLLTFLTDLISHFEDYKRRIVIKSTEVNTGAITIFNNANTPFSDLPKAAVASASIAGVFPPFYWGDGRLFMDGGASSNINVISAIDQCLELVDDESKITIDVMICNAKEETEAEPEPGANTISNFFRARGLSDSYVGPNVFRYDIAAHPKINWRYLAYEAEGHAGGTSEINFNGDATWPMQE